MSLIEPHIDGANNECNYCLSKVAMSVSFTELIIWFKILVKDHSLSMTINEGEYQLKGRWERERTYCLAETSEQREERFRKERDRASHNANTAEQRHAVHQHKCTQSVRTSSARLGLGACTPIKENYWLSNQEDQISTHQREYLVTETAEERESWLQ